MTRTLPAATRAAAALALAAAAVAGCGSSSESPTFTGLSTTATPTYITHTSRVPKVVSPEPVPVGVPVEYNAKLAVRYAAWLEAREWCTETGRGDSCVRAADEKFADVAYSVRAREEYRKQGTYSTVLSTPPVSTSYSTVTSIETKYPALTDPYRYDEPTNEPTDKFAGVRVLGGIAAALITVGGIVLWLRSRRPRPAHVGTGAGTGRQYGTGYAFDDDLNTDFGADADANTY